MEEQKYNMKNNVLKQSQKIINGHHLDFAVNFQVRHIAQSDRSYFQPVYKMC